MKANKLINCLVLSLSLLACNVKKDTSSSISNNSYDSNSSTTYSNSDNSSNHSSNNFNSSNNSSSTSSEMPPETEYNDLKIHFFDVGQGDGMFIELPNNETMIIDAGKSSTTGTNMLNYIMELGFTNIDYMVASHHDEDHIGGLPTIINSNLTIEKFFYSENTSTNTNIYKKLMSDIATKCAPIETNPKTCENYLPLITDIYPIVDIENLKVEFIAPVVRKNSDRNNMSLVTRIKFYSKTFLLVGDCEDTEEASIVSKYGDALKADLLKVGHHGSETSTTQAFLDKVKPEYAVIQSGLTNSYGHPRKATINRLVSNNVTIYRNDNNGTVIAHSNGNEIDFTTQYYCKQNILPNFNSGSESSTPFIYNRADYC